MITIRIPAPTSVLAVNLLGALGLIAIVVAVAGLAGVWWAVLTAGLAMVGLAVVASTNLEQVEKPARPVAVSRSTA